MKTIINAFIVFISLAFFSCKKVINVNLNNAAPQIVIVGNVTDQPGPYQVTINSTVNFSDPNVFPPVLGAQVLISDNTGIVDTLTDAGNGQYLSHTFWQGVPGNTYTLSVTASGKSYTAVSTMPQPVSLDSIGFQQQASGRNNNIIEAVAYFQDPSGYSNYYQFIETINGVPLNKTLIFDDRLSQGKYIELPLFTDSSYMNVGDQLILSMYNIDQNVFQYFSELEQLVDANPYNQATPANPDTNLSGGALGYFSAHTVQTKKATVQLQ